MRKLPRLLVVLLCCLPVFGQNIRYDSEVQTTTGVGQFVPVLAIPGAIINFYTGCTVLPCGTKATTFTAVTGSTACPSGQQVVWQLPLPQACTSSADSQGNFGGYFQPGAYQYTITIGSTTTGPYQFNVGGGGGGGSGVSSINSLTGPFTFNGAGVLCTPGSPNVCSFTGGSGGGVNPGVVNFLAYYSNVGGVSSDGALSISTPTAPLTDQLSFVGGGGIAFSNQGQGGNYNIAATNTVQNNVQTQINLSTNTSSLSSASNPGQISISTNDSAQTGSAGNSNAANILISATEASSAADTNSGNVTIQAQATFGSPGSGTANSGNVNISAANPNGVGGNVTISGSGPGGGNVTLNADASAGSVIVNGSDFQATTPNFTVDETGDVVANGSIRSAAHLSSAVLSSGNCLQADASGNIVSAAAPCGSGGGGSGITGQATGFIPLAGSSTTLTAQSHLDEVTNAGFDTFSQGVMIGDGSGVGGSATGTEGAAPAAGSSVDTLWADSSSHRWKQNPNNTGATMVTGIASAGTSGHCVQLASNGIDLADSGAACAGGSGGTPTFTADSGVGSGSTITIVSGSTDFHGYVNVTVGSGPSASAGVVTIKFGNTYTVIPKCVISPANSTAAALSGNAQVYPAEGTATTALFVITVGSTALTAGTTYDWTWSCGQ